MNKKYLLIILAIATLSSNVTLCNKSIIFRLIKDTFEFAVKGVWESALHHPREHFLQWPKSRIIVARNAVAGTGIGALVTGTSGFFYAMDQTEEQKEGKQILLVGACVVAPLAAGIAGPVGPIAYCLGAGTLAGAIKYASMHEGPNNRNDEKEIRDETK